MDDPSHCQTLYYQYVQPDISSNGGTFSNNYFNDGNRFVFANEHSEPTIVDHSAGKDIIVYTHYYICATVP